MKYMYVGTLVHTLQHMCTDKTSNIPCEYGIRKSHEKRKRLLDNYLLFQVTSSRNHFQLEIVINSAAKPF